MNRLQSELHRLYIPDPTAGADSDAPPWALIDGQGRVRAMVLELTRPASWELLSPVWHGVQTELQLPAPAIAVSGIDGLQLWFSLAEPVTVPEAHAFLESLRVRFLPAVESARIRLWPGKEASALRQELHARQVPARQEQTGDWSAFVAPDLAPVFGDTPWLDIPPSEEGQAALLRGLDSIARTDLELASNRLKPASHPPPAEAAGPTGAAPHPAYPPPAGEGGEARRFLRRVMNDDAVALALRIEAAKALLPYSNDLPTSEDR